MNKKKFVIVTNNSYILDNFILSTLTKLSLKYKLYIISNIDNANYFSNIDASIIRIPIKRNPSLISDVVTLIKLTLILLKLNPYITHSFQPKAGFITSLASFIARVPNRYHTFTGQVWRTNTGLKRYILKRMDGVICMLSSKIACDSKSQSVFLKNQLNIEKDVHVYGLGSFGGVNLKYWSKVNLDSDNVKKKYKLLDSNIIFAYIARKKRDKGAFDVIRIFHKYHEINKNCKLLYLGPAEEEPTTEIKELKLKLGNAIISIDQLVDAKEFLSVSDVLLLPSYREGFGSIVINAASMGIPTIAYDIYGLQDSVSYQNGYLAEEGNEEDFVKLMEKIQKTILSDRNQVNNNCINWAKNFTDSDFDQHFLDFHPK
jgi:glycosyltransferase involved in cell wall biosynthesis